MSIDSTVSTEKVVSAYIKMRDVRSALKKSYEEQDATIKAQMESLETHLNELCKAAGVTSMKTSAGTIMQSVKTNYFTSDWSTLHAFILENQVPELLERRISQVAMREFLAEHPDKLPKGLNVESRYSVTIRRA